jgi:hypothetical protein
LQPIENLRRSNYGHNPVWVQKMQEDNQARNSQGDRQPSQWCGSNSMHQVRSHGGCTDRGFQCRSMSLNARCAKSVLRWISQSTTNTNQSAAVKTWVGSTQHLAYPSKARAGVGNEDSKPLRWNWW